MILRVGFEVFGQVIDAFAENRHLNFGGAGVRVVRTVAPDERVFLVFRQCHVVLHERARTLQPAVYGDFDVAGKPQLYLKTTAGWRNPDVLPRSARPTSRPSGPINRTRGDPCDSGASSCSGPRLRPCLAHCRPSSVSA